MELLSKEKNLSKEVTLTGFIVKHTKYSYYFFFKLFSSELLFHFIPISNPYHIIAATRTSLKIGGRIMC